MGLSTRREAAFSNEHFAECSGAIIYLNRYERLQCIKVGDGPVDRHGGSLASHLGLTSDLICHENDKDLSSLNR